MPMRPDAVPPGISPAAAPREAWVDTPRAILLLIALNLVAHFIPFERASLSPDDYYWLLEAADLKGWNILAMMAAYPERPISSAIVMLRAKLLPDDVHVTLILVFVLSTAVLLGVRSLLRLLLHDQRESLLASIAFCLLPNKLETYHSSLSIFVNFAVVCYVVSLILFLKAIPRPSAWLRCGSVFAYTIGLFSYQVGFFAPAVLFVWCLMYRREGLRYVWLFMVPVLSYFIYRAMVVSAIHDPRLIHHPGFQLRPLRDVFHHYAGFYLARSVLYGGYKFSSMESPWLAVVVLADALLLFGIYRSLPRGFREVDPRLLLVAVAMFAFFMLPLFLQEQGGIAGRHLVLPSIAVVLLLLPMLRRATVRHPGWLLGLVGAGLVVCQGNAWIQVVSCRINAALYDSLRGMKARLAATEHVLIDVGSFRKAIPSGWTRIDSDFLNTYYGAETFEDWSLTSMARLASGQSDKRVHIVVETPVREGGMLSFTEAEDTGSRAFRLTRGVVEATKALTIDFEHVYGDCFGNGTPVKRPGPAAGDGT